MVSLPRAPITSFFSACLASRGGPHLLMCGPFLHHQTWRQSPFSVSQWLCFPPHMASEVDIPANPSQRSRDACAHLGNPGSPISSFTVPYTKSFTPRGGSDRHNFIPSALVNSLLPLLPSEGKAPTLPTDVRLTQSPTSRIL